MKKSASAWAAAWIVCAPQAFSEEAKLPPRPPLEAFAKLPVIEKIALSPDGSKVAVIAHIGEKRNLAIMDLKTNSRSSVGIGDTRVHSVSFADNRFVMIEISETKGGGGDRNFEHYQVSVIDTEKQKLVTLFHEMEHYYPTVSGAVWPAQVNGKTVLYAPNWEMSVDGQNRMFQLNPASGAGFIADEGTASIGQWLVDPSGRIVARTEYTQMTKVWRLEMLLNHQWKTMLSQTAAVDTPSLIGLGRDGQSVVIFQHDGDNAGGHYYEIAPDGTRSAPLEPFTGNVRAWFHPKTRRLIGFSVTKDWTQYSFFDPEIKQIVERAQHAMPDHHVRIEGFAYDPTKMLIFAEGPGDPGGSYFLDLAAKSAKAIGEDYPDVPSEWVAESQSITYKAADGLDIQAVLTLPPGKDPKNLKLIVLPHGGPEAHDTLRFDYWVQALASRGYAVLQPNFRGSDNQGAEFVAKGWGEWGRKMQTDLSDGVRALVKQGLIDPKGVCIVGGSYGGYAALAGAAFDHGVYACAASIAGISDLKAHVDYEGLRYGYETPGVRYLQRFMGPSDGWDAISPAHHADQVDIPVLLIHGLEDTTVQPDQSYRMRDALKAAHKTYDYLEIPGENHNLLTESSRITMLNRLVEFLEKYNPPS